MAWWRAGGQREQRAVSSGRQRAAGGRQRQAASSGRSAAARTDAGASASAAKFAIEKVTKTAWPMVQVRDFQGLVSRMSSGSERRPSACMFCPMLMPIDATEPMEMPTGAPQSGSSWQVKLVAFVSSSLAAHGTINSRNCNRRIAETATGAFVASDPPAPALDAPDLRLKKDSSAERELRARRSGARGKCWCGRYFGRANTAELAEA